MLIWTVSRCFDVRFALWDLENAVTKRGSSTHIWHFLTTALETSELWGSNPPAMGANKNGPLARTVSNSVVGDEGCRVRLTPPAFASGLRPSRAALENASRFLSSAPGGFESLCDGPKKKGSHCWEPNNSVVGDEGFEPPALCV